MGKKKHWTPLEELFDVMKASENEDLPDGAWWQVLEDTVVYWNTEHKTAHDPNDTVHKYLRWKIGDI